MKTVCKTDRCSGCMACVSVCGKGAIQVRSSLRALNAVIDPEKCMSCGACQAVCPGHTLPVMRRPIQWSLGWANAESVRLQSASGGLASALAAAVVESGGAVCACAFQDGKFGFRFADSPEQAAAFAGSRYVKSDPSGIYGELRARLKKGQKVLFIGLPCQAAGVRNAAGDAENLYVADLICHGAPAPSLLELFLSQHGKSLSSARDVQFRKKALLRGRDADMGIVPEGARDCYTIAFLGSLSYTDNCYECAFARTERCSDLTLGDAWGSDLAPEEQKKGVSLALCQTEKGRTLLESADVTLIPADRERMLEHNAQLRTPSRTPEQRERFFRELEKGASFDALVRKAFPKTCRKERIKGLIYRVKRKPMRGSTLDFGIRLR